MLVEQKDSQLVMYLVGKTAEKRVLESVQRKEKKTFVQWECQLVDRTVYWTVFLLVGN
jgi:membrane protein YqaA with SNARE-associated domain